MDPQENAAPGPPAPAPRPSLRGRALAAGCWAYLAAALAVWLVLLRADEWWPATILMFAPRWVLALPLLVLAPAALLARRRSLAVLAAAAVVVGGPVTGFNVPWAWLTGPTPAGTPLRVMTLNMHYGRDSPPELDGLVADAAPDVVAVQEWPGADRSGLAAAPGWNVHRTARLFLASRHPIRRVVELGGDSMGEHASAAYYELGTPAGTVHVFSLHAATDRRGIADTIHRDRRGPAEIRANSARRREQCGFVAGRAAACRGPVVVVGDFNTPPESPIWREAWGGYTDAFAAAGWGWGYTFAGAGTAVRIDHVLAGRGWRVVGCWVGPAVGSPHRPVLADLLWTGQPAP